MTPAHIPSDYQSFTIDKFSQIIHFSPTLMKIALFFIVPLPPKPKKSGRHPRQP
jgi:hypothetical protein